MNKTSNTTLISSLFTGASLTIVCLTNGKVTTDIIDKTHANWKGVVDAYRSKDYDKMVGLINVKGAISSKSKGRFEVKGDGVWFNGEQMHGTLFDRVLTYLREGIEFDRLLFFADKLWSNPSARARNELYRFLESKNLPICEDGDFLAYKAVDKEFYSLTSGSLKPIVGETKGGKIYNGVGSIVEVERGTVDDDCNRTCSFGIHAGDYGYSKDFAGSEGIMLIVKINPKDVVAIPTDCNSTKLRTCRYAVIACEDKKLDEIKDIDYEKSQSNYHNKRNALGRFAKA